MEKVDKHMVALGPLTYLTVKEGSLAGAFRREDGKFFEFEPRAQQYILHDKEYYEIVVMNKFSADARKFGPYTVITVCESEYGIFEKAGRMEVADPGFYKLSSEYKIYPPLPRRTLTVVKEDVRFRTKDGVQMFTKFAISCTIADPVLVFKFDGGYKALREFILKRVEDHMCKLCRAYSRQQLLPTVIPLCKSRTRNRIKVAEEEHEERDNDEIQKKFFKVFSLPQL